MLLSGREMWELEEIRHSVILHCVLANLQSVWERVVGA